MQLEADRRKPVRLAVASMSLALLAVVFVAEVWDGSSEGRTGRVGGFDSELLGVKGGSPSRSKELEGLPESMMEMIDFSQDVCEDPYEFACGNFIKKTEIPSYASSWTSSFDVAFLGVMEEMRDDLTGASGEAEAFYQSCMDEKLLDKQGTGPLLQLFHDLGVDKIESKETFNDCLISLSLVDRSLLFGWSVSQDEDDSSAHMVAISVGGISMPDREYYLDTSPKMAKHRDAMLAAVTSIFSILDPGEKSEAGAKAMVVLEFETMMAKSMLPRADIRALRPEYWVQANLTKLCPSIEWERLFAALNFSDVGSPGAPRLAIYDPPFLSELESMLGNTTWANLRTVLRWQMTKAYSPYLPASMIDVIVDWYRDLYGTEAKSPRWKKCFASVSGGLPQHISRMYIEGHAPPGLFDQTEKLLANIRSEFWADFEGGVTWMSNASKILAIKKLEAMGFRVGGPKKWSDRPALNLSAGAFLFNEVAIETAAGVRERKRLRRSPDRTKWGMASTTVNAYYDREKNALFIPAAILREPFFSQNFSWARNYGAIGTILGHEMTHGFDDVGHLYDSKGRRGDVRQWDEATEAGYASQADCIAEEFSNFTVSGGIHVNGRLTLGEDIADAGGLKLAYSALKRSSSGAGLTALQTREFFLSFAQLWCDKQRDAAQGAQVMSDEHAPAKWRVNGALRNFKQFSEAFGCRKGSLMRPAAGDRCVLW